MRSDDLQIEPMVRPALLPREGDMAPVGFEVLALRTGMARLTLSVFLAREMALLEQFEISVEVVEVAVGVAP